VAESNRLFVHILHFGYFMLAKEECYQMLPIKRRFFVLFLLILFSIGTGNALQILAQEETACDLDALLEHQQEHAARIADLQHVIHDDPDAALESLYIAGIAYQVLAVDCGFARIEEAAAAHAAEHEAEAGHEDEHDHAAVLEAARAIGDPENGEVLFTTVQTTVGFACATCHRVDTTEQLIGPGLLGVGNPEHDPSAHEADAAETAEAEGHAEHSTATGTPESADHTEHTTEEASRDPVEYLRTSILDPGAFLVPGFPDYLMPRTYGEVFTAAEINDLIAYLMTL
jgi:cytochrome c2